MINQYIEQQLNRKNRGVYFKKGKWVFHLVFTLFTCIVFAYSLNGDKEMDSVKTLLAATVALLPFLCFFYFYCLYLIPVCFKRNKRQKFWVLLLLLLATVPLVEMGIQYFLLKNYPQLVKGIPRDGWALLLKTYKSFVSNFTGFTSMLFVMELLEEVRTSKEIYQDQKQLAATELNMVKTQINPEFMVRSLDSIISLSRNKQPEAPEAVIHFSDVLRYRLYRSNKKWVPLNDELQQLTNLFRFQNFIPALHSPVTLETEGAASEKFIAPLSLINIAEPLLTTFDPQEEWSLLFYMLIEEKELQIAIELTSGQHDLIERKLQTIQEDMQRLSGTDLNFTREKDQNNYSLRICLPIYTNLTAS